MKKIISVLLAVVFVFSAVSVAAVADNGACGFAVATDIHYVHPMPNRSDYVESVTAFNTNKSGHTMQHESGFIIDAFLKQCAADDSIDFILVPGDLATYGRDYRADHETVAAKFRKFEQETGKQVYVINGNHDNSSNPQAVVSHTEFAEIYNEFGYDKAFSVDSSCCSYAVELNDEYALIALDSCDEQYMLANGVDSARLSWLKNAAKEIKAMGKKPILMMHHNLLEHKPLQRLTDDKYIVDLPRTYASMFADMGIKLVFTGHTHTGDVAALTSPSGNTIYDFCSPALNSYPSQYRRFTLTDKTISYDVDCVKTIDGQALGAVTAGYSADELNAMSTDFQAYAKQRYDALTLATVRASIAPASLDIAEDSPLYSTVDKLCTALKNTFDIPLYGDDGLQKLAAEKGIKIPDSKYNNVWEIICQIFNDYTIGNRIYNKDTTEAKIAYAAIEYACATESDIVAKIVDADGDIMNKLIQPIIEAFLCDDDGIEDIKGSIPGYGEEVNSLAYVAAWIAKIVNFIFRLLNGSLFG